MVGCVDGQQPAPARLVRVSRAGSTPAGWRQLLLLCALESSLVVGAVAPLHSARVVAALLGARTVASSPCVNGLDFLDLISGNYGLHSNATNPRDCCGACGAQPGCQHFSWVHAHQAVGPVRGLSAPPGCWLKLDGVVWTRRLNTPTSGNRAPPSTEAAQYSSSSAAPSWPGASTPAVGYEPAYVVVGGDCLDADSCNATMGACDEPEANSTRSVCAHCLGGSIHAPTGGSTGDCPESGDLLHGQSCDVGCPDGMYPAGEHPTCQTGAIVGHKGGAYNITCEACAHCEGIHVRTPRQLSQARSSESVYPCVPCRAAPLTIMLRAYASLQRMARWVTVRLTARFRGTKGASRGATQTS